MPVDTVLIRSGVVNRSRLSRGLGRMEFYRKVGCDPRTGVKILNQGRVCLDVARRTAEALSLPLGRVIDLDRVAAPSVAGTESGS